MERGSVGAAVGVALLAATLLVVRHVGLLALTAACLAGCCAALSAAVWHLARSNERIETLLRQATTTSERLGALASGREDGESAEWVNALISAYLWPRLITPLIQRDVVTDTQRKLADLITHRKDPDAAAHPPDWIESLEVDKFELGATAPVVTALRCVAPAEAARCVGLGEGAAPSGARVFDVDVAVSTEDVDVVLRALVGGGVLAALDWVGGIAGALQQRTNSGNSNNPPPAAGDAGAAANAPPANSALAVHVRRLDFSARVRVALRTETDLLLIGVLPSPAPRCRLGLDVRVMARAGPSVALPLSRVPGMAAFLESVVLREIAAAVRWPHALPLDVRPGLEAALLPPGAGAPRTALPECEMRVSLIEVVLADTTAAAKDAPRTSEGGGGNGGDKPPQQQQQQQPLRGPFLCIVGTDGGGKRRELSVDLAGASPRRADGMSVTITPPPAAQDVGETLTFVLRRPVDHTRRLGGARDAMEGFAKVIGDRARAAAAAAAGEQAPPPGAGGPAALTESSPTLGVGKLRMVRLACGTALLLTPSRGAPALLAVTTAGGADDATAKRGLGDVSPLPGAAFLDIELFPPGGAHAASGTLRVRVDLEWKQRP
jgi:hypothetical protein